MSRRPAAAALALAAALAGALLYGVTAPGSTALGATGHRPTAAERGGVGSWTKISKNGVGIIYEASMVRTGDGDLHVAYPRDLSGGGTTIGHTAIHTDGSIVRQNDVLVDGWSVMDRTPVIVDGASGLHTLFGGQHDITSGFFDDGRMYMADATSDTGAAWTLPAQAVGLSHSAEASYGTGAVELADGTPLAEFPLNNTLTWHVGTGPEADSTYTSPKCCLYDTSVVRDGDKVWVGWYQNGDTGATNGTFAMQIYPSLGTPIKAPGSSQTSLGSLASIETGRVALAARKGGGVYEAYCVGYPSCDKIRVWKVGTDKTNDAPHSKYVDEIALSAGPSGRLWVAWADNVPKVRAVRTGVNGLAMGAVQTLGVPRGHDAAYSVAVEGSRGRGDVVINVGDGFWHTQVFAGLTLQASPHRWHHGSRQKVVFTVTDARSAVKGAKVKVGSDACRTGSRGTCSITFPASFAKGRHTARATKSGYGAATTGLRVG